MTERADNKIYTQWEREAKIKAAERKKERKANKRRKKQQRQ